MLAKTMLIPIAGSFEEITLGVLHLRGEFQGFLVLAKTMLIPIWSSFIQNIFSENIFLSSNLPKCILMLFESCASRDQIWQHDVCLGFQH